MKCCMSSLVSLVAVFFLGIAAEAAEVFSDDFEAYTPGLLVPNPPAGDLNTDDFVGQDDLNIILAEWGAMPPTDERADPSGDGFVGQDDLNPVLADWGQATQPGQGGWELYAGYGNVINIGDSGNPDQSAFSNGDPDVAYGGAVHAISIAPIEQSPTFTVTAHVLPRSFTALEVGGPGGTAGLAIEIAANTWFDPPGYGGYRVEGTSPTQGAVDNSMDVDEDSWHELKIVVDRVNSQADFTYTNLSTDTVVQEFLDVNFVSVDPVAGFTHVRIYSWGEGRFDNVSVVDEAAASVSAVPESNSLVLLGLGAMAAIGLFRRRRGR